MRIAILGTGIVGKTVAAKLIELGHEVIIGTRDREATLTRDDKDAYGNPPFKEWHKENSQVQVQRFKEAAQGSELMINCTGGQVSIAALEFIGEDTLEGKTLVDIANPLDFSQGMPPSLKPVNTDSLGEQIQTRFPNLKVVKTLNTMSAHLDGESVNGFWRPQCICLWE